MAQKSLSGHKETSVPISRAALALCPGWTGTAICSWIRGSVLLGSLNTLRTEGNVFPLTMDMDLAAVCSNPVTPSSPLGFPPPLAAPTLIPGLVLSPGSAQFPVLAAVEVAPGWPLPEPRGCCANPPGKKASWLLPSVLLGSHLAFLGVYLCFSKNI